MTEPTCRNITKIVHPIITPNIVGIVFLKPKLKAEWEVTILFGPGENDVAIPNSIKVVNSGYIFIVGLDYLLSDV